MPYWTRFSSLLIKACPRTTYIFWFIRNFFVLWSYQRRPALLLFSMLFSCFFFWFLSLYETFIDTSFYPKSARLNLYLFGFYRVSNSWYRDRKSLRCNGAVYYHQWKSDVAGALRMSDVYSSNLVPNVRISLLKKCRSTTIRFVFNRRIWSTHRVKERDKPSQKYFCSDWLLR